MSAPKILQKIKSDYDVNMMGKNALRRALKKELEKLGERSYIKDFLAGVDPTGSKTFSYGVKDAPVSSNEKALRMGVGVAGGILGGALLVPSVVSGLVGMAGNITKGPTRMVTGFGKGFVRPIKAIVGGTQTIKTLGRVQEGATLTPKDVSRMASFGGTALGGLTGKASKLLPTAEGNLKRMDEAFTQLKDIAHGGLEHLDDLKRIRSGVEQVGGFVARAPRTGSRKVDQLVRDVQHDLGKYEKGIATADELATKLKVNLPEIERQYARARGLAQQGIDASKALREQNWEKAAPLVTNIFKDPAVRARIPAITEQVSKELKGMVSGIALSGLVGGGSAALQYRKGTELGEMLTPAQRKKL